MLGIAHDQLPRLSVAPRRSVNVVNQSHVKAHAWTRIAAYRISWRFVSEPGVPVHAMDILPLPLQPGRYHIGLVVDLSRIEGHCGRAASFVCHIHTEPSEYSVVNMHFGVLEVVRESISLVEGHGAESVWSGGGLALVETTLCATCLSSISELRHQYTHTMVEVGYAGSTSRGQAKGVSGREDLAAAIPIAIRQVRKAVNMQATDYLRHHHSREGSV